MNLPNPQPTLPFLGLMDLAYLGLREGLIDYYWLECLNDGNVLARDYIEPARLKHFNKTPSDIVAQGSDFGRRPLNDLDYLARQCGKQTQNFYTSLIKAIGNGNDTVPEFCRFPARLFARVVTRPMGALPLLLEHDAEDFQISYLRVSHFLLIARTGLDIAAGEAVHLANFGNALDGLIPALAHDNDIWLKYLKKPATKEDAIVNISDLVSDLRVAMRTHIHAITEIFLDKQYDPTDVVVMLNQACSAAFGESWQTSNLDGLQVSSVPPALQNPLRMRSR